MLDKGVVKLSHVTPDGDEHVIDIRQAPMLVGAPFVYLRKPSLFDAVTLTNCSIRWCSDRAFMAALGTDEVQSTDIQALLCAEVIELTSRIVAMSTKSSKLRLRRFLAQYGRTANRLGQGAPLPFKQSLVASFLNVTPEHLCRLMKRMTTVGFDGQTSLRSSSEAIVHTSDKNRVDV